MIDTKEQLHQRLKDIKTQPVFSMNGLCPKVCVKKGWYIS